MDATSAAMAEYDAHGPKIKKKNAKRKADHLLALVAFEYFKRFKRFKRSKRMGVVCYSARFLTFFRARLRAT